MCVYKFICICIIYSFFTSALLFLLVFILLFQGWFSSTPTLWLFHRVLRLSSRTATEHPLRTFTGNLWLSPWQTPHHVLLMSALCVFNLLLFSKLIVFHIIMELYIWAFFETWIEGTFLQGGIVFSPAGFWGTAHLRHFTINSWLRLPLHLTSKSRKLVYLSLYARYLPPPLLHFLIMWSLHLGYI